MADWTRFMDMHSGGSCKEPPYEYIYIEADYDEARRVFYGRFGHNPERVTCTCCGDDYSISSEKSLEQLTAYDRNCDFVYFRPDGSECSQDEAWKVGRGTAQGYTSGYVERQASRNMDIRRKCKTPDTDPWGLYMTVDEYLKRDNVLVIRADEIKPEWRNADLPEQGYVWID